MASKRRGLGRGLGALIPTEQQDLQPLKNPTDIFFGRERSGDNDILDNAVNVTGDSATVKDGVKRHASIAATTDLLLPSGRRTQTRGKKQQAIDTAHDKHGNVSAAEIKAEAAGKQDKGVAQISADSAVYASINVAEICPNPRQPRDIFDEERLAELADSIREVGVLQPVVVRSTSDKQYPYELIMGERRWRAAQSAGLQTIPAIIRKVQTNDLLRDALLENLHRAQLNPLEEAAAYEQLMTDFGCTQQQLSKRISRSRSQIANTIRLLRLPSSVQKRVAAEVISAGHARALLSLTDSEQMEYLADRIVAEGLSVRTTEEIVAVGDLDGNGRTRTSKSKVGSRCKQEDPRFAETVTALTDYLDTRVKVQRGKKRGKIVIDFSDEDDLQRIQAAITGAGMGN